MRVVVTRLLFALVLLPAVLLVSWACVAGVNSAEAHPLPANTNITVSLHRICTATLICRDKPPRPKINCGWNNRGQREVTYDPILDALVTWRCDCPWGKYGACHWVRVMVQPVPADYLIPQTRHYVWDWMRKCAALVCLPHRVTHFYRSLRFYPGTA